MDNLKKRRREMDMSQAELANELNVHQTLVSQWERGVSAPNAIMLASLADVLNTSTDYLLGRTDDPFNYDDGDWIAEQSAEVTDYFNGDMRKVRAFELAVEEDRAREAAYPYPPTTLGSPAPVVTSAAAHFDPNTLTEEGREMYLNLVQMLAEKYSKSNT